VKKLVIIASTAAAAVLLILLLYPQFSSRSHTVVSIDKNDPVHLPQTVSASPAATEIPSLHHDVPTPYQPVLIEESSHFGTGSYTGTFTCTAQNGNAIDVTVTNKGTSPVLFKVSQNDNDFGYIKLASKAKLTRTFHSTPAGDISGNWRVYVTNDTGAYMNLQITAGQFKERS